MSRTSTTYRESCVIPPGFPVGPGSPTTGDNNLPTPPGGTGANGGCGPLNPSDPSDPTNADCSDPVFASANPSICGNPITLVLSPSVASIPVAGTQQYSTFLTQGGNNITVTQGLVFSSSDSTIASITSPAGVATGVTAGTVIITATWHGYTGAAQLTVSTASGGMGPPGGPLCNGVTADFVVLIDNSLSMGINSRLSIAKQAATGLVNSIALGSGNCRVAIAYFDGSPNTAPAAWTQSPWSSDGPTLIAAINAVPQTTFNTQVLGGYTLALGGFTGSSATYKSLIILSDGAWSDDASSGISAARLLNVTTVCGGIYASGQGFTQLQAAVTPGYFYNLSTGSGSTCTMPACLYQSLSQFPSQVCSGVVWGYALPVSPTPATVIVDPETPTGGGTPGTGATFTETASFTAQCSGNNVGDSVTKTATYTSSISQADAQTNAQAAAQTAATAALTCCGNQITINDAANATPFPACYEISGFTGTLTSIEVTLDDFTHSASGDVYVVVVNPSGIACQLLAGNGGITSPAVPVTLTFTPGGATLPVHNYTTPGLTSGTYAPVQLLPGQELSGCLIPLVESLTISSFGALDLSGLGDTDPNGIWKLYVCDNSALNVGYIGSWFVTINGVNACDCATAPSSLHVHGAAGGNLSQVTCPSAGVSTHTAWDGTGLVQSGSQCVWTTGILTTTKSLNGRILYSATVSLQTVGGTCYYVLDILTTASDGGIIDTWHGYKAGAFESGPAGVYNYSPLNGFQSIQGSPVLLNTTCSPGPATIQLDAM